MFPTRVETGRLHLRRFDEAVDLAAAHEHFERDDGGERVFAYVTHDPHDTRKETLDELADITESWTDGDGACYAVVPKGSEDGGGQLAGDAHILPQWDSATAYLGVRLHRPYWGRGYSGERADALLTVAFDHLDLSLVRSACHVDNEQSERAIEKYVERFGGTFEGTLREWLPMDDGAADVHQWSIHREEFAANRDAAGAVTVHE